MLERTPPSPIALCFAFLFAAAPVRGAGPEPVRAVFPALPVAATEYAQWLVPIQVVNDMDAGIFGDSITCDVEDLDPGVTRSTRRHRASSTLTAVMPSVSRHDSALVIYKGVAVAEHARLKFHLFAHTAEGQAYEMAGTCETSPSLISRSFRSTFIEDKGKRIELVRVPTPWPRGPVPGLLIIHGEGSHARHVLPLGWVMANAGYSVMLVSLPGYGLSGGEPDFAGPASIRAVGLALDELRRSSPVDASRIAVWGVGRGATAAALLAAERPGLSALVLQSGVYDPESALRDTQSDTLRHALKTEAKSNGGWNRRSALRVAGRMKLPVLFLHGEQDPEARSNQAADLAGRLRAAGGSVQLELIPDAGHALPSSVTFPIVRDFLKARLRLPQ